MSTSEPDKPSDEAPERSTGLPHVTFRNRDQVAIAAILTVCILLLLGQWLIFGGASGQLIEIDDAPPRIVKFKVDINQADWREFNALPSIGEKIAKRIIAYRDEHGPFEDHGDLMRVEGIGARTLLKINKYLMPIDTTESVARTKS